MLFKHLLLYSAESLVNVGSLIHTSLVGDERLAEADAVLAPGQQSLIDKVTVWKQAYLDARSATSRRRTAVRALRTALRDFGFGCLTLTDNSHSRAPYARYFPDGYGMLRRLTPAALITQAGIVLDKLTEEAEPTLLAYVERIQAARASCQAVESDFLATIEARKAAFEVMDAEKLRWVMVLSDSWGRASTACYDQMSYLRSLYRPAFRRHRSEGGMEPDDGSGSAEDVPETGTVEGGSTTPEPASVPAAWPAPASPVETVPAAIVPSAIVPSAIVPPALVPPAIVPPGPGPPVTA